MALPVSSLSVALQGFADFLDGQFGQDVIVTLDTPVKAQGTAENETKAVLNIFAYRLAPSGFHADAGSGDPLFLRAQVLLTCFPNGRGAALPDADLRVLGHAMSVLHSLPVIPLVLPGAPAGADDFRNRNPVIYRLQATLLAPQMEELNHIWTTQGGELAYRLSVAYELSLIPVEPLTRRIEAPPPRVALVEVHAGEMPGPGPEGVLLPAMQPVAMPLLGPDPPVDWVPVQLWAVGGEFVSVQAVSAGTAAADVALAGPLGARVAVIVTWTRAGGAVAVQPAQSFVLGGQRLDDPAAQVALALQNAADGDRAEVRAFPADAAGVAVPGAPGGNVLTLTVGPAP